MKIAIAGYGVEGQASYRYFSTDSNNQITIVDQAYPGGDIPPGVKTIVGQDAFNNLTGFDKVVRTPALSPDKIKTDGKIWSATNEFFAQCPAKIIGVTGTKGKGTVSSLISSILTKAGKKVWLVGNIGIAALEVLPDISAEDIVVYELSSFQLWDIEYSPQTAVLLYVEPEHLNIHRDLDDYFSAKMNITKFQGTNDQLIYYKDNQSVDATASRAQLTPYPDQNSAHIRDGQFYYKDQALGDTSRMQLIGEHNLINACAAIDAVWSEVQDADIIMDGLASFEGLPHRLKLVGIVDDVTYFDDSIATSPSATIAALDAIDQSKHLILGGSSKGLDYSDLARRLVSGRDVVGAYLAGEEAAGISASLDQVGFTDYHMVDDADTMLDLVTRIHSAASGGQAVLLSPAAASFGQFKDYIDRGNQFIQAVESL